MHAKRSAFALVLMFVGGACLAQSSDEFGRATGGVLELSAKGRAVSPDRSASPRSGLPSSSARNIVVASPRLAK